MSAIFGRLAWLVMGIVLLALSGPAAAHLTPNSEVRLSIGSKMVTADIIVPRGEYAYATGNPFASTNQSRAIARDYLVRSIRVRGSAGERWSVVIDNVEFVQIAGPPDLHATARFLPPQGQSTSAFTIDWHVIVDDLPNHFALFVLERTSGERDILGAVRSGSGPLTVDRPHETAPTLLLSAMALGVHHIIGGYDHLMFLLALLLPAPLIAVQGRWRLPRPRKETFIKLASIVTAFTIGHSVTLIGATLDQWSLPSAPVETAIAVSVLVSAIHAIRPLVPGREPLIAGAFGLVHGLAFATLVQDAGAGVSDSAISLLGFNLGIELVQMAIVVAITPGLLIFSRRAGYRYFRIGAALVCAAAAVAWIVNRTTGIGGQLVGSVEGVLAYGLWALLIFVAFTIGALLQDRIRQNRASANV